MFQEFAKRKLNDYLNLPEFPDDKISFNLIKNSSLPPFIISFIEFYVHNSSKLIERKEFEDLLRKAISFNINYVIRPKYSLIKFLFGDIETRPADFIKNRLGLFQFYGYYTAQLLDFINYNSLEVVSLNQVEYVIYEVNKKLLEEITGRGSPDSHRLNLVKILYYFFHDLSDNNPINLKLPKKILSLYFADKGFNDIKKRLDSFFSDEIFIQEAIEIMNPETMRTPRATSDIEVSEKQVKDLVSKAKSSIINKETSKKEIEKITTKKKRSSADIKFEKVINLKKETSGLPLLNKEDLIIDEEIYSGDLFIATKLDDLTVPAVPSEDEQKDRLLNDLFAQETFRKKIIKKIFSRQENKFRELVKLVLDQPGWNEVTPIIEKYFNDNKIDYYSDAAVKFVDILQSHFTNEMDLNEKIKAV